VHEIDRDRSRARLRQFIIGAGALTGMQLIVSSRADAIQRLLSFPFRSMAAMNARVLHLALYFIRRNDERVCNLISDLVTRAALSRKNEIALHLYHIVRL